MRGGIPIVIMIVSFALCVLFFIICSYMLGVTTDVIGPAANDTLGTTVYQSYYNSLLQTLQRTFGIFTILTLIGIILAYALDTHREEGEEFRYYENYR